MSLRVLLRHDHQGEPVDLCQVQRHGSGDVGMSGGRTADEEDDGGVGAALVAEFVRDRDQLTGDRSAPAFKVPAGLRRFEPGADFVGQPAPQVSVRLETSAMEPADGVGPAGTWAT